jgi:hypothetical protein
MKSVNNALMIGAFSALGFSGVLLSPSTLAATYSYADVTGWDTLSRNTPTVYSWKGINDLTVTRLGAISDAGMSLSQATVTFPAVNPNNPEWIAGTRDFLQILYDSALGIDDTMSYRWDFANPLSAQDFMVFADFDFGEEILVDAYDTNNQLIPFSAFTFAQENGNDPNGSTYSNILFSDGSSFSSSVYLASPGLDQVSNPIVTLQSSIPISRLEYFFLMDDQGLNITNNSIRVNFATPVSEPTSTPEPTSSLALLAFGAAGVYRWRMGKPSQAEDDEQNEDIAA